VRSSNRSSDAPAAFLVHGYQCNKSMMLQLAKYLALNGIDSYAIDLPGHGASPEPHVDERAPLVAAEALEYLVRHEGLREDRIVLIGHSYGANVLGRVALADPSYAASVFLGPGSTSGLTPGVPKDLFVLTAEHDYDFIVSASRSIMADATGGALAAPGIWQGGTGRARLWRIVPGLGHVGLILSQPVFREVLNWIETSTGFVARPERTPATRESLALVLLVPAALAGMAMLWSSPAPTRAAGPMLRPFLILGCAWFTALLGLRHLIPLRFLHLREGEILASLIFIAGTLAAILDGVLCRGAHLPSLRSALRGIPAALGAVALLYLCAALLIERDFYHVAISPGRGAVAVIIALAVHPFFAFCEGLFPSRGAGRAIAVGFVYGVAALSLCVLRCRLERFGPALFALGTACAVVGPVVARLAKNPAAAPAFSALTAGWILAVGFMRY
jgi:pimeloyl-ACP methyl ester carboxylesterase